MMLVCSLQFITQLKLFCIQMAVKLIAITLLLKLELLLTETCKTSMLKIAAKALKNAPSSLMKVEYNRELFSYESCSKSFRKS